MCGVGAAIGAGIGLLLGSRRPTTSGGGGLFGILNKMQGGDPTGDVAPIEKPLPPLDSAPRPEEISADRATFNQSSKRAQLGLKPGSKPSDLKNIGVSAGLPKPGGRQSPTGVVAP